LFGARLSAAVAARESQVVLGLDPDPATLWPGPEVGGDGPPAVRAGRAVAAHCAALIDAAGPACVAVKPQVACFERLGGPGWDALGRVAGYARAAGLLVLADAKRGDIGPTAAAYAEAFFGRRETPFGELRSLEADAITASPLLGRDSLEPLISAAREQQAGVFVLVRTSNPGAADVQDAELTGGAPLWERLAALVAELGRSDGSGLADVGAVCGATAPEHLARMRELMPSTPFLLPGVGAQGGEVEALAPAFAPGPAGGLIAASRSIAGAHQRLGGSPARAARREAEALRRRAWDLQGPAPTRVS